MCSDIFIIYVGLAHILGFKILNFNIFFYYCYYLFIIFNYYYYFIFYFLFIFFFGGGGVRKMSILGGMKILWIFLWSHHNTRLFGGGGHFYAF